MDSTIETSSTADGEGRDAAHNGGDSPDTPGGNEAAEQHGALAEEDQQDEITDGKTPRKGLIVAGATAGVAAIASLILLIIRPERRDAAGTQPAGAASTSVC